MTNKRAVTNEALGKKKTKANKEVRGSLLDLAVLLPVLAFIFFSITHPAWYSTYITGQLFGPLLNKLGAWLT
jgi:hypothetical protein